MVARLRSGQDLRGIPNLLVQQGASYVPAPVGIDRPNPPTSAALMPFCPIADIEVIGAAMDELGRPPPVRKTLETNDGCPFSKPVANNPAFDQVELSGDDVTTAGCSFCFMGGDYRALPVRQTVGVHLDQIDQWQGLLPRLDEVVLRDQHAIGYLPLLLKGAVERGLEPFGILIPGRGDAILRYTETLRKAVDIARDTGFWFTLYLIGFESFSAPQLERFNKGVTPKQYGEALSALWDLHYEAPETFRLTAYGASSFILWDPWTTVDDLQDTVDFIQHHAVRRLSRGFAHTRLRLYPNLPLFHRARRDGLLLEGSGAVDRGAAHTGYAAEAPWLTADGRVAVIEELCRRLLRNCKPEAQIGALRGALHWARSRHPKPLAAINASRLSGPSDATVASMQLAIAEAEQGWRHLRRLWQPQSKQVLETRSPRSSELAKGMVGSWQQQVELRRRSRRDRHAPRAADAQRTLTLGTECNNRCQSCVVDHDRFGGQISDQRIEIAAQASLKERAPVTIGGREPLLVPGILGIVRKLRKSGAQRVELVSNGRGLAIDGVAARLVKAGVTELLLKRHRLDDALEDQFTQAPGSGDEFHRALKQVQAAGLRWRMLIVLARGGHQDLDKLVTLAVEHDATGVQVQVLLSEADLDRTDEIGHCLQKAAELARQRGIRFAIEGD
ncbi:MAG TPA: hypothetical protein DCQ06_12485 [Myxococcales bacterium]|nr:hypothetical protein [Myxococcales bacterium]